MTTSLPEPITMPEATVDPMHFHGPHAHLASPFGNDWIALKAEAFARFFGTPTFLLVQTVVVVAWVGSNTAGLTHFDIYPYIFLNLAFSLQAAYAAPLILLAQTRQAARDKAHTEADALHRDALHQSSTQRQELAEQSAQHILDLLDKNTQLTAMTKRLSERIETLTVEIHKQFVSKVGPKPK